MNHRYNRKSDLPDHRDHLYEMPLRGVLPTSVDLRPFCSHVVDQKQIGSCTANAGSGAYEFLELKQVRDGLKPSAEFDGKFSKGSRLFLYYNERLLEGTTDSDSGASLRDCVKSLHKWGICQEKNWPYHDINVFKNPSPNAYAEAKEHKIIKYSRVADLNQMKAALASGYPVLIGITVYESFESEEVAKTGIVPIPKKTEALLGGHALLVVGYLDATNVVIVRNSWSANWGDKGYCYLPYDYISNPGLASDFWCVTK